MRRFQSTPSGGKATVRSPSSPDAIPVSIHAFRGEGDSTSARVRCVIESFNPRLPGGRRLERINSADIHLKFQSTPSGGKAT